MRYQLEGPWPIIVTGALFLACMIMMHSHRNKANALRPGEFPEWFSQGLLTGYKKAGYYHLSLAFGWMLGAIAVVAFAAFFVVPYFAKQ